MDGYQPDTALHAPEGDAPGNAPPHNIEAEQAFLGALLYDNEVLDRAGFLHADHFYDPVHARIYEAARERIAAGQLADAVTLKSRFERDEGLNEIGGPVYLAELERDGPSAASAPEYARLVFDLAIRRAIIALAGAAIKRAGEGDLDTPGSDLIAEIEAELFHLSESGQRDNRETNAGDALEAVLNDPGDGVKCGLRDLDEQLGGFRAGAVYVLAGRSSMGKSALGLEIARRIAADGKASAILSLEMPPGEVAARLAATNTGIAYRDMLRGRMTREEREAARREVKALRETPLAIMDVPGLKPSSLRSRLRRWKRAQVKAERSLGVAVVDYLQLMDAEQSGSIYERVSSLSRSLKPIARDLGLPLIVLSQLSRESEKDGANKRPASRHLRDSGAIEEDADAIVLVYRDAYYAEREPPHDDVSKEADRRSRANSMKLEADVAKNRQGAVGRVDLWADVRFNRFKDWV